MFTNHNISNPNPCKLLTLTQGRTGFYKGGLRQRGYIKPDRNGRPIMRAKCVGGGKGGGGPPCVWPNTSGRPLRFATYERS